MRLLAALAVMSAFVLGGCDRAPVLAVDGAWVRLSATPRGPAAAYFTVHGGPTADRLMEVSSPVVIRIEMHESMKNGSMMSMKPIAGGIEIPAGGTVDFKPGGRHLMLYYVNPGILPPRTLQLTFSFASGERIVVDATVARAGDR
jgi:periplasmic copper chaperone A